MLIIAGMFKDHEAIGFYPVDHGPWALLTSGVIRCPLGCTDMPLHYSYDGTVLPMSYVQVKNADEGRVIKDAWPAEFWERWQLGEDRLFHLREELPQ